MAEKEYVVVVNAGVNLEEFDAELAASSGSGPIPARSVEIANPRIGSKRMTHWMLTDDEATTLMEDPRVLSVEIPPDQRDDIQIGLNATQAGNFYRGSAGFNNTYINWGLRRNVEAENVYGNSATTSNTYDYALDGTGVDVVIQDSGIDPDHPDWFDAKGNTRFQSLDWYAASGLAGTQSVNHYRDRDGHGSHCASIAAGLLFGTAKGSHIYSQKLEGLETLSGSDGTGIPIADAFDAIRLWHANKTNGRPTVVNMSWGYGATITVDPTSGIYRGTPWTYGVDYTSRNELFAATGVSPELFSNGLFTFFRIPVRVPSVDAEIEDMITAGIHVCIAAGNNLHKADVSTGPDYNNSVVFSGISRLYHQGSSPFSDNAFMVGNIDSSTQQDGAVYRDKTAQTTTRGPGVNIYAPGTNISAATSREYDTGSYTTVGYPGAPTFPMMSISGTSMAAPQVAGVCARHLQSQPDLTPAQLQTKLFADAKSVIFSTGSAVDYDEYNTSLMGSENRMLFDRYGKQPLVVKGE